jgi:hypothetical protein
MKNTATGAVEVTFRRLRSGRAWKARFDMGGQEANNEAILREAWNTYSEILSVAR